MNRYIADLHFGHKNIIGFDNRPFLTVKEMEETLINNWNSVVKKGDTTYILGDFCWDKADEWLRLLNLLNGSKVLIRGNHDLKNMPHEVCSKFADIKDYKEIKDNGKHVIMCHYPIMAYKASYNPNVWMLHGHTHTTKEQQYIEQWTLNLRENHKEKSDNQGNIINVGCMMPYMNYTPRTLDEVISNMM